MSGISEEKSIEYWRKKWDQCPQKRNDYDKTLTLLKSYTGGFRSPLGGVWLSRVGSFFRGSWHKHHRAAVCKVMREHTSLASTVYDSDETRRSVDNLLADLKHNIGNNPMNPKGNLSRILAVIKEKTGVDYENIDTQQSGLTAIQRKCKNTNHGI